MTLNCECCPVREYTNEIEQFCDCAERLKQLCKELEDKNND